MWKDAPDKRRSWNDCGREEKNSMNKPKMLILMAVMNVVTLAFPARADAYSLYWSKVYVATSSENTCMQFAFQVASQKLHNVHKNNLEVAGSTPTGYASITCIGTGQRAMAVVMAVSDSDAGARGLRDQLATAIQRIHIID
jgi:hypothetical protein